MANITTVNGLEALNNILKDKPTPFIVFYADPEDSKISWCPDCSNAEPILQKYYPKDAEIVYCYVGDRPTWKSKENVFRTHEKFALTSVPTVIDMKSGKRIVEGECSKEDAVKKFFS